METAIQEVLARWAYSEIVGANASHCYDGGPGIEALRAKHSGGVTFTELSSVDQHNLAGMCAQVRSGMMRYMDGVTAYRVVDLARQQLAGLFVPRMISNDIKEAFVTFETFMSLPRADVGDPRGETRPHRANAEPLTIGFYCGQRMLLDGYHRAVSFWKSAPGGAVIAAYDPVFRR